MEIFLRVVSFLVAAVLLGILLWFAFTLFAALVVIGCSAALLFWLRAYLIEKEILNPSPGTVLPPQPTVIEGDYEEIKK